ncbi:hypothetical protein Ciccas_001857 [Cichlidogyrus casuarinus]|uniref:Uncharacterized protein n=1 Tax=Cichlidogyrus casuarinus TaxID=1844966 RepID=A0ABD2QJ66_9PLAT
MLDQIDRGFAKFMSKQSEAKKLYFLLGLVLAPPLLGLLLCLLFYCVIDVEEIVANDLERLRLLTFDLVDLAINVSQIRSIRDKWFRRLTVDFNEKSNLESSELSKGSSL